MTETPISFAARDVLSNTRVEGMIIYLPPTQLERKLYEEVNEALARLGGKWKGGRVKGHIFKSDPSSDLQVIVQTGLMPPKNPTAYFPTPQVVIEDMLHASLFYQLDLHKQSSLRLLEPSAGKGAIARALRDYTREYPAAVIHCCEVIPAFAAYLRSEGFEVVAYDFLTYHPDHLYDGIMMNPPFSVEGDSLAYLTHIEHAWSMLAPNGVLVAVAPAGFTSRQDRRTTRVRTLVEEYGGWQDVQPKAFAESGTNVATVILSLIKPAEQVNETMERAKNIPFIPPHDLDNAYELTQTIEKAIAAQNTSKEVPVFGSQEWISRARTQQKKVAS